MLPSISKITFVIGLTLLLSYFNAKGQAPGSDCSSATNITASQFGQSITFTNFTDAINTGVGITTPGGCGTFSASGHRDVWYQFTANYTGPYRINFTPAGSTNIVLAIYGVACGAITTTNAIACNRGIGTRSLSPTLTNGVTYRLRIIQESTGTISTSGAGLIVSVPTTTPCERGVASTPVVIGDIPLSFNLDNGSGRNDAEPDYLAANPTGPFAGCGAFSYNPTVTLTANRHRWARFQANFTGPLNIIFDNTTPTQDAYITLHELPTGVLNCATDIASTQVACADAVGIGADETITFSVTNGRNYYIRVINKTNNTTMNGFISLRRTSNCSVANSITMGSCSTVMTNLTGVTVDDSPLPNVEPNCITGYTSAARSFAWRKFTATYTGTVHLRYASNSAKNVALVVYQGNAGLPFNCANQLNNSNPPRVACAGGAATTASVNVPVIAGREYMVRIINNTDADVAATGELCLLTLADACTNASLIPSLVTATPLPATIYGAGAGGVLPANQFTTTDGAAPDVPACWGTTFTAGTHIDGWVRIDASFTGQVDVTYDNTSPTKNVAIAIYQDPNDFNFNCAADITSANLISCGDLNGVGGNERATFNAIQGRTYYIRAANLTDNETLTGNLIVVPLNGISEATDACADATLVEIGSCNITANILGNYDFNTITNLPSPTYTSGITGCGSPTSPNFKDGWIRFAATFTGTVSVAYTNTSNQNAALFAYEGTPTFNCTTGVTATSHVVCINANGAGGNETLSLPITLGREYYIRIVNTTGNGVSNIMTGSLCITPASLTASNVSTAPVITLVGVCGFSAIVPATAINNGETVPNPSCFSAFDIATHPQRWVRFEAPYTGQVLVMYDATNNDGQPVMAIYTGTPPSSLTQVAGACNANSSDNGSVRILLSVTQGTEYFIRLINQKAGTLTMPGTLCLSATAPANNGPIAITCPQLPILSVGDCNRVADIVRSPGGLFPDGQTVAPFPLIPTGDGGGPCSEGNVTNAWFRFSSPTTTPVTIEYSNSSGNVAMEIYTTTPNGDCSGSANFITCTNNSTGFGTERVSFTADANTIYFVRVMEVSTVSVPTITKGSICIYTGTPVAGDYCSNARAVQVGNCDITMPVLASQRNAEGLIAPACAASFNPIVNNDAWVRFTAQYGNTRITYNNFNDNPAQVKDLAIALYGGNCSKLTLISCANSVTGTTIGEEVIEFNTIAGTEYFIRIMNLTDSNEARGAICISNGLFANCSQTLNIDPNAPAPLPLNVCNYDVSIPATGFPLLNTPAASGCENVTNPTTASSQEAWTRFRTGTTINSIRLELQASKLAYLAVYTGACPSFDLITPLVCGSATSCFYQAVQLTSLAPNTDYFVRIINVDGGGMSAKLCLNENVAKMPIFNPSILNNICTDLNDNAKVPLLVSGTDCGIQFNIANDCGAPSYNLNKMSIPSGNATCGGTLTIANVYGDALAQFAGTAGTQIVIRYDTDDGDPNNNQNDAMIEIHNDCPLTNTSTLVACVNAITGEGTEELIFTPPTTGTYYIRLVAIGAALTNQKTLFGRICLNSTSPAVGDLCSTAKPIVVDLDCNTNLNIPTSFNYLDAAPASCATPLADAWATFTATSSRSSINFEHEDNVDVAVAVYRGTCGSLVELACVLAIDRPGGFIARDSITIDIPTAVSVQYFVRIMNISNETNPITNGKICITNTIASDVCSDTDLLTVPIGTCNARVDIPIDFDEVAGSYPGLNPLRAGPVGGFGAGGEFPHPNYITAPPAFVTSADPDLGGALLPATVRQDAWFRVVGTGERMTIHYENINGQGNPAIAVYVIDPGPINCGNGTNGAGRINNEWVAANAFEYYGRQTETVIFNTIAGQQFLVRIMNVDARLDNPNPSFATLGAVNQTSDNGRRVNMRGNICIFNERKSVSGGGFTTMADNETTHNYTNYANPRPVLIGDCDIQMNILSQHTCTETTTPPDPTCANNPMPNGTNPDNTATSTAVCQGDIWATFTTPNTTPLNSGTNRITIQYNNNNFNNSVAPNVALAVYATPPLYTEANSVATPNAQTNPHTFCSNRVIEGLETVSFIGQPNTTYYVRIIRLTTGTVSVYGRLCLFYGDNLSEDFCTSAPIYRNATPAIDGTWQPLEISDSFGNEAQNNIPNCVVPGGSNPTLPNPAVNRDAWVRFELPPADPGGTGYTIQYDNNNGDLISGNVPNVAIAIYQNACPPNGTNNNYVPNACTNKLWEGVESITFLHTVTSGTTTYYVRVMNVSSQSASVQGKIRITKFANCQVGSNLAIDGQFDNWGSFGMRTNFDNQSYDPNGADNRYYMGRNRQTSYPNVPIGNPSTPEIQYITAANPSPDSLLTSWNAAATALTPAASFTPPTSYPTGVTAANSRYTMLDRFARFATVNGYLRDNPKGWHCINQTAGDCDATTNVRVRSLPTVNRVYHNGGTIENGEFGPEGRYTVGKNPQSWFVPFYGFGVGFNGYGGDYARTDNNNATVVDFNATNMATNTYCANPALAGSNACAGLPSSSGNPLAYLAAPTPTTPESNFLMVNAWWKTPAQALLYDGNGKLWCQTISVLPNQYFIFNAWFSNMIPVGRNIDLPQLIISICDMENPQTPVPAVPAAATVQPALPGETYVDNNFTHSYSLSAPFSYTSPTMPITVHQVNYPTALAGGQGSAITSATPLTTPGRNDVHTNRGRTLNTTAPMHYGASRSCNLFGEAHDARIKYLGTDIFLPETPDNWIPIRCIYKSPNFSPSPGNTTVKINLCIENRSLTRMGNDLAVDGIFFAQCTNADATDFENFLKGNTCELADAPIPGFALSASMIEFGAFYLNGAVELRWKTSSEANNSHFVVERSQDGRNFQPIGMVRSKGDLNQISSYDYTDRNLTKGVKRFYYRLKIVNKDNKGDYGPITDVLIPMFNTEDLKISPNPIASGEILKVDYEAQEQGTATIIVTDILGNRFLQTEVKVNEGYNQYELNTRGLPTGMYIVSLGQGTKKITKKMIIL